MKRLILIAFAVAVLPGSFLKAADAPKGAPTAVTDPKEQEELSRAMLNMVLLQNNLLAARAKYPDLLAAELAASKANEAYGVVLQAARVKHNAGPFCELVAATKDWNCAAAPPAPAAPGTPAPAPAGK